jgi:putative membrane protein insertion efficiency factor
MAAGIPVICIAGASLLCFFTATVPASALTAKMRGPDSVPRSHDSVESTPVSTADIALRGAIRFFQKRISPIDGPRCGFHPTCSVYGDQAISSQGPFIGILMTADRLIRCNFLKKPADAYTLLPGGRLHDPPSMNVLSTQ